jgi:hypothetical protein
MIKSNTSDFTHQKQRVSDSYKNQYNNHNENKMRKRCINKLKQLVSACTKQSLRAFNGTDYRTSITAGCDCT